MRLRGNEHLQQYYQPLRRLTVLEDFQKAPFQQKGTCIVVVFAGRGFSRKRLD